MPKSQFSKAYDLFLRALIAERKAAGLTQTELAASIGKPQPFVSKFERGVRRLDVIEYCAIARALGTSPTALLRKIERKLPADLEI